jgi:hypothetical protein
MGFAACQSPRKGFIKWARHLPASYIQHGKKYQELEDTRRSFNGAAGGWYSSGLALRPGQSQEFYWPTRSAQAVIQRTDFEHLR